MRPVSLVNVYVCPGCAVIVCVCPVVECEILLLLLLCIGLVFECWVSVLCVGIVVVFRILLPCSSMFLGCSGYSRRNFDV